MDIWREHYLDGEGNAIDSTRTEAVVVGTVALDLRTSLSFSGAIRTDNYELTWPIAGGVVDTTLAYSTFLAEGIGVVNWISHPVIRGGGMIPMRSTELLEYGIPSGRLDGEPGEHP
jgi:hypothetical protein